MPSRHPDELYINGIQRESFLPAIQLIKDRFEVVDLNSPTGNPLLLLSHIDQAECQIIVKCQEPSRKSTTTP